MKAISLTLIVLFLGLTQNISAFVTDEISKILSDSGAKPGVNCVFDNRAIENPDKKFTNKMSKYLPGFAGDVSEIMFHAGTETNAISNKAAINAMYDFVLTDDKFFVNSYRFLKKLRAHDVNQNSKRDLTPITEKANLDVWKLALENSNGNKYYAMKTIDLYGHDNMANDLPSAIIDKSIAWNIIKENKEVNAANVESLMNLGKSEEESKKLLKVIFEKLSVGKKDELLQQDKKLKDLIDEIEDQHANTKVPDCRVLALNFVKPLENSVLYLNGSISSFDKSLEYSAEDIEKGKMIAKNCNDRFPESNSEKSLLRTICNENHLDYQGDYYHVLHSTFLSCRNKQFNRSFDKVFGIANEYAYLSQVKKYKLNRFNEDFAAIKSSMANKVFVRFMETGLSNIGKEKKDILPAKLRSQDPESYDDAKVILDRMDFEVKFRIKQHKLGYKAGQQQCQTGLIQTESVCSVD